MLLAEMLDHVTPQPRRFPLGRQWSYVAWTNTAEFSTASKDVMFSCLIEISTKAFGADMTSYWADRDEGGFFERITKFCLLVDPTDTVAGWTGYHRTRFGGMPCLYLDSSGVLPELQGDGLMGRLHTRMITHECIVHAPRPVHLVTRTENPVVYRLLRDGCGADNIWPSPHAAPSPRVSAIGSDAADWLEQREKFEPATLSVRGAYDNLDALYGDLPSCGEAATDEFFRTSLRPEDAYIVVARITIAHAFRAWVKREMRMIGRVTRRSRAVR